MLNKQEIASIQRLVRSGKTSCTASRVWRKLHEEQGIGSLVNNRLLLEAVEIKQLRSLVRETTELDPLYESLDGGRVAVAATAANEKLSSQGVFAQMLQLTRAPGLPIPTLAGEACIPRGALLSVPSNLIRGADIEKLVVIENGAPFRHWYRAMWPEALQDAIFIYRGHGENMAEVKRVALECPRTHGFFDLDPAGLMMAAEMGVDSVILPRDWRELTAESEFTQKFNKVDIFQRQRQQLKQLQGLAGTALAPLIEHLEKHQLAITQEHMLAHALPLELFPVDERARGS